MGARDPKVGPRSKWRTREAHMRDNPGSELDPTGAAKRILPFYPA